MAVASQSLSVNQMYEKLLQNGEVESNSPKNRLRLYRLLQLKKFHSKLKLLVIHLVKKVYLGGVDIKWDGIWDVLLNGLNLVD